MESTACDVLVIGSGAAGMTTAITAHHLGADVLVVEKAAEFGGTTARSGGWLWVPGNPLASRSGSEDSLENARAYIQHEAGNHFDEARVGAFLTNAGPMVGFLEAEHRGQVQLRQELSRLSSRSSWRRRGRPIDPSAPLRRTKTRRQSGCARPADAGIDVHGHGPEQRPRPQAFPERHEIVQVGAVRCLEDVGPWPGRPCPRARHAPCEWQCTGGTPVEDGAGSPDTALVVFEGRQPREGERPGCGCDRGEGRQENSCRCPPRGGVCRRRLSA